MAEDGSCQQPDHIKLSVGPFRPSSPQQYDSGQPISISLITWELLIVEFVSRKLSKVTDKLPASKFDGSCAAITSSVF